MTKLLIFKDILATKYKAKDGARQEELPQSSSSKHVVGFLGSMDPELVQAFRFQNSEHIDSDMCCLVFVGFCCYCCCSVAIKERIFKSPCSAIFADVILFPGNGYIFSGLFWKNHK